MGFNSAFKGLNLTQRADGSFPQLSVAFYLFFNRKIKKSMGEETLKEVGAQLFIELRISVSALCM